MAVTWPVAFVWTRKSMMCFSLSLVWRRMQDFAWRKFLGGRRFAIDNCAIEFEQKRLTSMPTST
jgi:hypothetical protein